MGVHLFGISISAYILAKLYATSIHGWKIQSRLLDLAVVASKAVLLECRTDECGRTMGAGGRPLRIFLAPRRRTLWRDARRSLRRSIPPWAGCCGRFRPSTPRWRTRSVARTCGSARRAPELEARKLGDRGRSAAKSSRGSEPYDRTGTARKRSPSSPAFHALP